MIQDGRQVAPDLDGIRADHVQRYRFAGERISEQFPGRDVLDIGCGCGYGSFVLAGFGLPVLATDIDAGVLEYGAEHYAHDLVTRRRVDWETECDLPPIKAAVAFEVVEHLECGEALLRRLAERVPMLVGSVPNENVVPFDALKNHRHVRHYRPSEVRGLLERTGWTVSFLGGQQGKRGEDAQIVGDPEGCRTIVFVATAG